jgi:hypothetical protein
MSIHPIWVPKTPIGDILKSAGSEGVLLESHGQGRFALLPLDDDVIDLLIERSPRFREHCKQVRGRMDSGQFQAHEEVRRQLRGE